MKYFGLGFFAITLLAIGSDAFALTDAEIQSNDDRLWLLIFIIGLMFCYGLGALKGGQR